MQTLEQLKISHEDDMNDFPSLLSGLSSPYSLHPKNLITLFLGCFLSMLSKLQN